MKKCIVTGAAGFTGCNLVERLLAAGYFVYCVVRENSAHNKRLENLANVHVRYFFIWLGRVADMISLLSIRI